MSLQRGLYDQLLTVELQQRIAVEKSATAVDEMSSADAVLHLIDLVGRSLADSLDKAPGVPQEQLAASTALIADILNVIQRHSRLKDAIPSLPAPPLQRLRAVGESNVGALLPETGLAVPWLFTASKGSPSLYEEIRRESASCDSIDILVSFITLSGVRKLMDVLQRATAPNAAGMGRTKIRVLTTTYTGATEQRALDMLARLNGCTVKVSLDGRRTRLHAKAWIFKRQTGFGTAYVGSANLSGAALLGGLEWTVKLTERGQDFLFNRASAHFETLWEDEEFTAYHPDDARAAESLRIALRREGTGPGAAPTFFFDITAKPYQSDMLQQLQYEREQGRTRSLLVAATGTGKTVMAALDYRRTVSQIGSRPRLLFVAHRQEILQQAMATYRAVLRDAGFGDLLVGGTEPVHHEHLFATIQTVSSRDLIKRFGADYWHTVVVDECHRLAAAQFDRFALAVTPTIFLGLTATPERFDGAPLAPYFDMRPDGAPAAELRLWHALDLQLLAPFEYFGCNDETDFHDVPWGQVGEQKAIENLVTGNQVRARMVMNEWERLSGDPRDSRALIFCVSLAHARFMTEQFERAGLPIVMLSGDSSEAERASAPGRLERGEICAIVTVDLYNEGIDIPCIDTLLFLRPTQSPLVFQQQLGRGLRLHDGKSSCLVLDFVGRHRAEFRFDRLLSSITGLTRKGVLRGVEEGFSTLPSGCHIHLEEQARSQILSSLRGIAANSWRSLKREVMAYASTRPADGVRLGRFLEEYNVDLSDVYRDSARSGWTTLMRDAGVLSASEEPEGEAGLARSFRMLLHSDDPEQLALIRRVAESQGTYIVDSERTARRMQMLAYQLDHTSKGVYHELLQPLEALPQAKNELRQLAEVLEARSRVARIPIPGFDQLPLLLHARYSRREVLTAVGYHNAESRPSAREGVLNLPVEQLQLLFVTLDKSDGFHDRIAYHDYAVSVSRFHWQTQNSAGPATETGRRYLESASNGWRFMLFVRETKEQAFFACGTARLATVDDVSGAKPMNIVWTLDTALPMGAFRAFSAIRGV